ncbi:MAG: ferritin family protein [Planctomycetes bacterium]|nr:ferritin family protein [Planctomycetota bacterium]MBL7146572.1 ferritin family protein [Phycisphaerae bacterium]
MDEFNSIEEILDFAIAGEAEASQFYMDLAGQMENPAMREVFESFAKEELGHKAKLEGVKKGNIQPKAGEVADLKIADYMVDIQPSPNMEYQSAIILAMKKEKAAFKLYTTLASKMQDPELRNMFLSLAQEEAKHKLRFEIEYDDEIMKEN